MFDTGHITHERRWWLIHSIGIAAVVGLTAAGYVYGVAPVVNMENEREDLALLLEEAKQREKIIDANQNRIHTQITQSASEVDRASIELHTIAYQNQRLAEITSIAEQAGIRINKLLPGEVVHGDKHDAAPFTIEASGTYISFTSFVRAIHSAFPDVGITQFSLDSVRNSADGDASVALDMVWHVAQTLQPNIEAP